VAFLTSPLSGSRGGKGLNTKKKKKSKEEKKKREKDKKRLGLFLQLVAFPIVFTVKQDETGQQQLHICFLSHFDGVRLGQPPFQHPAV
jgi:hypothetical protein